MKMVFRRGSASSIIRILCLSLLVLASDSQARLIPVTILHTTDLHGYIWPTSDYDGHTNVGGFLRVASKIESIRSEHPQALLIDCGDTYQGAPESYLTKGRLMVDGLNFMRYDAWVLGNHEFDWGTESLRAHHDQARIPFLAGNLYFRPGTQNWLPDIKPYVMRDGEGLKIAIIGLVTPGVPRWSRPNLLNGAMFRMSVEALQEIMPAVRSEKPDIIVVAAHQGFKTRGDDFANEIQAIARTFPEIDVLLGGHTHTAVEEMRFGNVLYSQAGYHGIWLGEVALTYDTVAGRVTEKRGILHVMDSNIPDHGDLSALWNDELGKVSNLLSKSIGYIDAGLDSRPDNLGNSSMQELICRSIAAGTDVDLVLHGSLSESSIPSGPLRYQDAWKIVPYENTIGVVSLLPVQIQEILEENFSRPVNHQSLGAYGITFKMEKTGDKAVISEMRDQHGQSMHPRKRYKVAMNSYVLASGGDRYFAARRFAEEPESRLQMFDADTRTLVVNFLRKNYAGPVELPDRGP